MNLFRTESIMTKNTFKEMGKNLIPKKVRIKIIIGIIILLLLFFLALAFRGYSLASLIMITTISFIVSALYYLKNVRKINFERLQESANSDEVKYTTSFNEKGFEIHNHATNALVTIPYKSIIDFFETKNMFVLISKASQFGIINKHTIDESQKREELINFLKKNCENIKW